jgi:tRNA(fMet)-specific endonuclease VapC
MAFLLDATALISVLRQGSRSPVAARMRDHDGELATSMLAAEELYRGAWRSRRVDENLRAVDEFLGVATPIDFTREDARVAGRIDAVLSAQGARIGPFDTLIAAQALVRGLILVTHNMREFGRVEGLRTEDWEAPGRRLVRLSGRSEAVDDSPRTGRSHLLSNDQSRTLQRHSF